ncbi:DUF4440 domain-containing protein [Duganella sp. FT134W]|uniref:DUF4440 domain-containing protein n=1 Tax=Duganella margarita TaxID=2692170 RepID=A0A7X4GWU4_9BURK|nr:nuclear transport factor 2 family protein [Duganella margarita]MYM71172.1 DUF4440 domain-containing protein [Duganella margarita]
MTFSASAKSDWQKSAKAADDAYWEAFNREDSKSMNEFLTDDVEFYHDRGGMLIEKKKLSAANDGMGKGPNKIRRESVPGTVKIFPMRNGEEVYGAIVNGEHRFYVTEKGKSEEFVGHAYFTQLMLIKGGKWKVSRIFSYEHVDAK